MTRKATDPALRDEHTYEPRRDRFERALDGGYEPHRDDLAPPARHLALAPEDPWSVALQRSSEYIAAFGHCRHPHCNRTLTDQDVTYCPHDLPFCEMCLWEDGCDECAQLAGEAT